MDIQTLIDRNIENEFTFSASRSSGPGGQNVNKVNTRVEIRFNLRTSVILDSVEKEMIVSAISKRITAEGELLTVSQSERSQLKNKEKAIEKMLLLISRALTVKPGRKPTKPTERSKDERIEKKRRRGNIKSMRKGVDEIQD